MRLGVRFSWGAFGVVVVALLLAGALYYVAWYQDSWGAAGFYSLGTLAMLAVAGIGYSVGRPWVLLVPWTVAAVLAAVGLVGAMLSWEWDDFAYGLMLFGTYAFWADVPLAVGLAVAVIRARHRRQVHSDRRRRTT
jgi:hypothetical protein